MSVGRGASVDERTTLEHGGYGAGDDAPRALGPLLFRLLSADDVARPSARWSLARAAEVDIGRAEHAGAERLATSLRVRVRDPFASSRHAHLQRDGAGWTVRDEGSRNGTAIDGQRAPAGEPVPLRDGALLEVGHTFFLFRRSAKGVSQHDLDLPEEADPLTLRPEWDVELAKAARLASTAHEILIEGESGSGKEVLARFIHERSRRTGPLVTVNCGALPEPLLEDELFGHVRGAFSGAHADRQGLFRAADTGTLLLDEVGDMPHGLQVKLLRVLEDHSVRPLGSEKELPVDVRLVAATNRDLEILVAEGKFRNDLLGRLGLVSLQVPALRERKEDLGLLVRAVLREAPVPLERIRFDLDALRPVLRYSWPLNVRELRRALLAAVDLAGVGEDGITTIRPHHLPEPVRELRKEGPTASVSGETAGAGTDLTAAERELRDSIVDHLRRTNGNVAEVARQMRKGRTQIQRWIARYGIDVQSARRPKI
jgi:sigma-54 dependent transcriptional regulator, acetoin dehydrogenase operon transcriptional activator AcoR